MEFLKETHIDFLGKRRFAFVLSIVLIIIGLFSIFFYNGLNYGIDFSGGTNVRIKFAQNINLNDLRDIFSKNNLKSIPIQTIGESDDNEVLVSLPVDSLLGEGEQLINKLKNILSKKYPDLEIRSVETVGPKVGEELKSSALKAILIALALILIYITFRFHWKFGISSIITLVHDVLIVVGIFSIFDKEFSLTVVAALLTVVGYSLNDTIVVFDRIRENMARYRKRDLIEVINKSINETLSRTMLTSGTTLFVVIALLILGGEIIHNFAFALMIGIIVGTYSSIYVASPLVLWLNHQFPSHNQTQEETKS